jgi:membrane protease YdiL (CAAX protease family)
MSGFPNTVDVVFLVVMAALMAGEVLLFAARRRAVAAGRRADARPAYLFFILYQWALVAGVVALWLAGGRPWDALLLGAPRPLGLGAGLALAIAYIVLALVQRRAILSRPALRSRARAQLGDLEALVPRTPAERRLWPLAAVTAGICEEVLFRGYLLAFIAHFAGIIAAVVASSLLFGVYHAYYGPRGILKTGTLGLIFAVIALWSNSLIPVIVLHAAIDLLSGDLAYELGSDAAAPDPAPTPAGSSRASP